MDGRDLKHRIQPNAAEQFNEYVLNESAHQINATSRQVRENTCQKVRIDYRVTCTYCHFGFSCSIIKIFTQNREDRKRVEKALDMTGLPSGKNDTINAHKFSFEEFFQFYKNLTTRSEVEKVFGEMYVRFDSFYFCIVLFIDEFVAVSVRTSVT